MKKQLHFNFVVSCEFYGTISKNKETKLMKNNKKSLYELIFNIALPVFLLNKLSSQFGENGPLIALLVALSFPVGYFLWDWITSRHASLISILGFVNILLTGCFALFELNSQWFAIKEASIPLLIGAAVAFTAFTSQPLITRLLTNRDIINVDLIQEKLNFHGSQLGWNKELKLLTIYLASTFLLSGLLNYIVTTNIVVDISPELSEAARLKIRNEQIADLTWKSYLIILAPSLVMLSFIFWRANIVLKKYTGLNIEKVLAENK